MIFMHTRDGHIRINSQLLTLEDFLLFFPDYALPENCVAQVYNQEEQLWFGYDDQAYQVPLGSTWAEGDAYLTLEVNNTDPLNPNEPIEGV